MSYCDDVQTALATYLASPRGAADKTAYETAIIAAINTWTPTGQTYAQMVGLYGSNAIVGPPATFIHDINGVYVGINYL
jgi:hypothetical protein